MADSYQQIILARDVNAALIPSGARIFLQKGTEVVVTQELGASITVNVYGNLVRIDGRDADALGREVKEASHDFADMPLQDAIYAQLRLCYDPEIPVNIVDLGLIYDCKTEPLASDHDKFSVTITMTLTAPGCGMGPIIADDAKQKVEAIPAVAEANIELVFDPPWDRSMMSDEAKLALGML